MTNVSAADNLQIDYSPHTWQLRSGDQAPMVYADANGLHYNERFASTRRLPSTGVLTQGEVVQVIAGYQKTDESWHLGVVLNPPLTESRGSRWCELAHWPDPDTTTFVEVAQSAGRGLATALNVPFRLIEPRPDEAETPAQPAIPPPPLPDLPLKAGLWTLMRASDVTQSTSFAAQGDQLVFVKAKTWVNRQYRRMVWHSIWAIIYLWLSLVTLRGDTALPNAGTIIPDPHFLPYLGVVIAFGFILSVFYHAYLIRSQPNLILVDPANHAISAWRGKSQRWTRSTKEAESIYISETTRQKPSQRGVEHGELNLYLVSGKFSHILTQGDPEPQALTVTDSGSRTEVVRPLERQEINSSLQAMGAYVAQALDVPVLYDRRIR